MQKILAISFGLLLLISILLLVWGFVVPHYSCNDKCNKFHFWAKYKLREDCIKNC